MTTVYPLRLARGLATPPTVCALILLILLTPLTPLITSNVHAQSYPNKQNQQNERTHGGRCGYAAGQAKQINGGHGNLPTF